MLDAEEKTLLTVWCRQRAMRWQAGRMPGAPETMLLEAATADHPFRRMQVVREGNEFLLQDARGAVLAASSDLQALLDAVDGGVADAGEVAVAA